MKQAKKKKRSRVSKKGDSCNPVPSCKYADGEEQKVLKILMEAFASVSLEEAASAYKEADGDPDKAAEILSKVVDSTDQEDQSTCTTSSSSIGNCIVGSSSSSNASDVFGDANDFLGVGFKKKSKPKSKKVIAVAGTVSAVLGKDYVRSTPTKSSSKLKEFHKESWSIEEAEQFLCSMLGEECELSLAVVSDVLCQCGFNLEKALDILLELSASSKEQVNSSRSTTTIRDGQYILESNDSSFSWTRSWRYCLEDVNNDLEIKLLADRKSDSTSRSSEIELQDNVWFTGNPFRSLSKVSGSSGSQVVEETRNFESELPQKVLESLFNMPTPRTAEHEPNTLNWRNVVKQFTSLGQRFEPGDKKEGPPLHAKGDEYLVHRAAAKQHWESMKSYYQKAAIAFTNGEKSYATYLSEKGRLQNKLARVADEKASRDIFTDRNRSIENMITVDLHGQHIKQAMRLLKLHLLFGAYVRSVRLFRVITGCGNSGVGKSKLKDSVINLLKNEGIEWSEENQGTLLIRLNGQTDFSFLDSGSDSE